MEISISKFVFFGQKNSDHMKIFGQNKI